MSRPSTSKCWSDTGVCINARACDATNECIEKPALQQLLDDARADTTAPLRTYSASKDRVRVIDTRDVSSNRGTIVGVSPMGYVRVVWDHGNTAGSPDVYDHSAAERHLRYVMGDDARPRLLS